MTLRSSPHPQETTRAGAGTEDAVEARRRPWFQSGRPPRRTMQGSTQELRKRRPSERRAPDADAAARGRQPVAARGGAGR